MSSSNFHRLVAFLVNICTCVLRELLIKCAKNDQCHPGYTDLSTYMLDAHIKNAIHALMTVRPDQFRKLYPSPGVFDESALDVHLLVTLLLDFQKNTYIQGQPVIQGDVKKALNDIRKYRNTLQHKRKTTDVDDREFDEMWKSLKLSSMTLAKTARGPAFEQEISDKIDDLMVNCLPGLPDILTTWFMDIVSDLRSQIADIKENTDVLPGMKEKTVAIKKHTDTIPGIHETMRAFAVDLSAISRRLLGTGAQCLSDGYRSVKLTLTKTIHLLQGEGDTRLPRYDSLEFLPDDTSGRIAALDLFNRKLVILSRALQPIGNPYMFDNSVYDLTIMSNDRLIVSAGNKFYILTVSKSSTIKLIKTLPYPSGLWPSLNAMSADTFTVCNGQANPPIATMAVTDNTVKRVDFPDLKYTKKEHDRNVGRVSYVKQTNSLVFTDHANSTVHLYNLRDKKTLRITDERIVAPVGVCAGPGGSVFVCSNDTHSIVHISATGHKIDCHKIFMGYPCAVAFSPSDSSLVVSSVFIGQNYVSHYKIE